jgi:hypothetical protein
LVPRRASVRTPSPDTVMTGKGTETLRPVRRAGERDRAPVRANQ